jgi:hypothetical protein
MDDENTTETEVTTPDTQGLGDAGKRALEAERKARAAAEKRAREAEAKVKEAEDADKSEVERLQSQVAELTKTAEAATARADRFEVAAAKGLSLAQARRLLGSTKEELEADADEMRSEMEAAGGSPEPKAKPLGLPKEALKSGASNEEDAEPDFSKLADDVLSKAW